MSVPHRALSTFPVGSTITSRTFFSLSTSSIKMLVGVIIKLLNSSTIKLCIKNYCFIHYRSAVPKVTNQNSRCQDARVISSLHEYQSSSFQFSIDFHHLQENVKLQFSQFARSEFRQGFIFLQVLSSSFFTVPQYQLSIYRPG